MILPFSTKINGKPSYFVEKILKCFDEREASEFDKKMLRESIDKGYLDVWKYDDVSPKLHTIREDQKSRWEEGVTIDFFINCRQKNMFRFAPPIPVVSVQNIFMTYAHSDIIQISIDDRELFSYSERLVFAINDGFDSWEDFFDYFYKKIEESKNKCFSGKIIHWTNLKY